MTSIKSIEAVDPAIESKPELTEAEKKELLEQAIQKRERLAESQLEMAKLFIERGKLDIARRRLKQIVDEFDGSGVVIEAETLLSGLR